MRTRIAVALFTMVNHEEADSGSGCSAVIDDQSRMVCDFGRQMWHQPIKVTVLGGIMVLNYALFRSV